MVNINVLKQPLSLVDRIYIMISKKRGGRQRLIKPGNSLVHVRQFKNTYVRGLAEDTCKICHVETYRYNVH